MNWTHAHFNMSACEIGVKLKPHDSGCPLFWILAVEWCGAGSRQIASFSPSTLENSVFKKHRFQIAPLWRAFSNSSVFGDRFRRCSMDDSRVRSVFENGLVWTGPEQLKSLFSFNLHAEFPMCRGIVGDVEFLFRQLLISLEMKVESYDGICSVKTGVKRWTQK